MIVARVARVARVAAIVVAKIRVMLEEVKQEW